MPGMFGRIVLTAMVICMAVSFIYLQRQQEDFSSLLLKYRAEEQKDVEVLNTEFVSLKAGMSRQDVRIEGMEQKNSELMALMPQIKDSITEIKSVISRSRVEALMIKDDAAQWKKDYVSVLVELEQRLDDLDLSIKGLDERVPTGSLDKIRQQLDELYVHMQKDLKMSSVTASSPASKPSEFLPPLPRFHPDWKEQGLTRN